MADRSALRLAIDLTFVAAIIGTGIAVYATRAPDVPAGVCTSDAGAPRYDAMLADGRITIAAVFGELDGGPADHNEWSYRTFAVALRERGFVETGERFERGALTIDLALVERSAAHTSAALAGALVSHDVVYYNGHSYKGALAIEPSDEYRVLVLDTCWSTQYYAAELVAPSRDVITNRERSVTGSIESFLALVDALHARSAWPLTEMNALAETRARTRAALSMYKEPERYRRDVACPNAR